MVRPVKEKAGNPDVYQEGYQQALEDFAIANLLTQLQNESHTAQTNPTQPELESLAANLIRQLTTNLNAKVFADYFNAMRIGSANIPPSLVHLAVPPPFLDLPANFPNVQTPRYLYGDKLRWISDDDKADWGIAIGRFYSLAPHQCAWTWCYLIWLDKNSPSATRVVADIAWEHDLEPVDEEKTT